MAAVSTILETWWWHNKIRWYIVIPGAFHCWFIPFYTHCSPWQVVEANTGKHKQSCTADEDVKLFNNQQPFGVRWKIYAKFLSTDLVIIRLVGEKFGAHIIWCPYQCRCHICRTLQYSEQKYKTVEVFSHCEYMYMYIFQSSNAPVTTSPGCVQETKHFVSLCNVILFPLIPLARCQNLECTNISCLILAMTNLKWNKLLFIY